MTVTQVLEALKAGEISIEEASNLLPSKQATSLHCKVSEKGAISIYGLQARFPVTLYLGQIERLIEFMPALQEFIKANRSKLSVKSPKA